METPVGARPAVPFGRAPVLNPLANLRPEFYATGVTRARIEAGEDCASQNRGRRGVMRAFFNARESERVARGSARRAAIEAALPPLVSVLAAHAARRVWVFGSFVTGSFDEHSDLDLATEGLPAGAYFSVRSALSEVCPVRFDLVEIERALPALRDEILAHGRLVFEGGHWRGVMK